jgi:hypothetical protein
METTLLALGVATWLTCGVLTYGGLFAYLQEKYPPRTEADYREQRRYPLFPALFGPLGLLTIALATGGCKNGVTFPSSSKMLSARRLVYGARKSVAALGRGGLCTLAVCTHRRESDACAMDSFDLDAQRHRFPVAAKLERGVTEFDT